MNDNSKEIDMLPVIRAKPRGTTLRNQSLQDILSTSKPAEKVLAVKPHIGGIHNTKLVLLMPNGGQRVCFYDRLAYEDVVADLNKVTGDLNAVINLLNLQGCDFTEDDLEIVNGHLRVKETSLGYYNKEPIPPAPVAPIGCAGALDEIMISCPESNSFMDAFELGYRLGDSEEVTYKHITYLDKNLLGFIRIQDWDSELEGVLRILNTVDNPYSKIFIKSYYKLNIHKADGTAYEAFTENFESTYNGSTYDEFYIYEVCMVGRSLACPLNNASVGGTCTGLYDSRSAIRIDLEYSSEPVPDFVNNAVLWVELNNEIVKIEIKSGMYSDGENLGYFINSDGSLSPLIGTVTGEFILHVGVGTDYCGSAYPTVGIYTVDGIWYSLDNPMGYSVQDLVTASKIRALCPEEIGSDMREGYDVCVNDFTPNHYIYTCSKVTSNPLT